MHGGMHADLTERIVGCAIEVHRHLGAGLLESVYEAALCVEFALSKMPFTRQVRLPLYYKGHLISEHRADVIVDGTVVLVTGARVGLILNFNSVVMKRGIKRVVR